MVRTLFEKSKLWYRKILSVLILLILSIIFIMGTAQGAEVIDSEPENNDTDVPIDKWIIIRFNVSMDKASVEKELEISPELTYNYRVDWSNDDRELIIKPNAALLYSEKYIITIIGAKDDAGNKLNDTHIRFKTESQPTISETITGMFEDLWSGFVSIVPNILLLIVILVIGYIISKGASWAFSKALKKLGFDDAMERVGVGRQLRAIGIKSASILLGIFVFWFIFVIVLQIAISVMGVPTISSILAPIVLFIPRILVAVIIILIGLYIANIVAQKLMEQLEKTDIGKQLHQIDEKTKVSGFSMIRIVSMFIKIFILLFFVQIALEIVNIGLLADFITPVLLILPLVLVALFIVLVGLLITEVIKKVILRLAQEFEVHKLIGPVEETIGRRGVVLRLFVFIVKLLIMLIFIQLAIGVLNSTGAFDQLAELINMIIMWIPNIIAGIIIILIGFWFAGWAYEKIVAHSKEVEIPFPETVATSVKYLIIFLAGVMAIAQIGFRVEILYIVIAIVLAAIFIGLGAGFAVGSKEIFSNLGGYLQSNKVLKVGSRVTVDEKYTGIIQDIGQYTTTILADNGQKIIIPNSKLISSVIIESVTPAPSGAPPSAPPAAPGPGPSSKPVSGTTAPPAPSATKAKGSH